MASNAVRLLPRLTADGPAQMALDEALLECASGPTLRLYRWSPPAVSLGYFQDYPGLAPHLPPGMAVVRRITGGGAIVHQDEVTYCLIGMLGSPGLPQRSKDVYPLLHGAIMAELRRHGTAIERQARTLGDRRYRDEPRCFASPAADDLVHPAGGKVLGSAARIRGQRLLVHGSLKLASNPWDAETVASCGLDWDTAAAALQNGILAALGLESQAGGLTEAELAVRDRILDERYRTPTWVVERKGPRP